MAYESIVSPEMIHLIREYTFETERKGYLPEAILRVLYQEDILRVMIPRSCGGLEWPLPKIVSFFEALAQADGNVGWLVNLGAGANMFAGYFDKRTAQSVFDNPKIWCAGSGAPSGKAVKTKVGYRDGYMVSGRWKYASGSAHATHFTANAVLVDEKGQTVMKGDKPDFRSFIFDKKEVKIYDTWTTTGLCATSSNDFSVHELFVPESHSFSLLNPSDFASGPLYHFPFDVLAVINMACMPVGMGMHFIELYNDLIAHKKPLYSHSLLKENARLNQITEAAISPFLSAREEMYKSLDEVWNYYEEREQAPPLIMDRVEEKSRTAARLARKMVFELYPLCGMNMVFLSSDLNKVWRDMSVASQHYLLSPLND